MVILSYSIFILSQTITHLRIRYSTITYHSMLKDPTYLKACYELAAWKSRLSMALQILASFGCIWGYRRLQKVGICATVPKKWP